MVIGAEIGGSHAEELRLIAAIVALPIDKLGSVLALYFEFRESL